VDPVSSVAGRLVLRSFRWHEGHADLSLVLRDPEVIAEVGAALARPFRDHGITAVVGLEARGLALAGLVARELGVGLVLARKPGSIHPASASEAATTPDWRGRTPTIRISRAALGPGDRMLLVDDWIETGSQARSVARLARRLGAVFVGVAVLVDDTSDTVRAELDVHAVLRAEQLPLET
jgi:adenine phosphoribosyltransferase